MLQLPRFAIGAYQHEVDYQPLCWALLAYIAGRGHAVQHFHSRACFPRLEGAVSSSGVSSRHLDSWLMSPETCREAFAHNASKAEVSVVDGRYTAHSAKGDQGGRLDDLCDWLDLPRLVVVDATQFQSCCLPPRPPQADGILLDKVRDAQQYAQLQTTVESMWKIPVLGAIDVLAEVRAKLDALPRGVVPERELCQKLGASFGRYARAERLCQLASRRPFPLVRSLLFRERPRPDSSRFVVAVAYDEAFRCYFPDALELLELAGASVIDFSPLRDEALPADADLVYLGCGHPERHALALAENHCMRFALRKHICSGRRIYAEGGGMAYLCEHLVTPDGESVPMVGALRATAIANRRPAPPAPATVTLSRNCWLGPHGTNVRGYLNSNWLFEGGDACDGLVSETGHHRDLLSRYSAIGSRMHVNFVSQPDVLDSFLHAAHQPQATC